MSRDLMTVTPKEWLKSFIGAGSFALVSCLVIALGSPAHAQTFDDAVSQACQDINANCFGTPGASGGSTTALSTESSPVEERKYQQTMGPINLFVAGGYERFNKDVTRFEPGYKNDIGRVTLGADYSFNNNFLIGGAFNYTRDNGDFKGGGDFDTDSYGPLFHATFTPAPKAFIDGAFGYMRKDYSIRRRASVETGGVIVADTLTGKPDGNEFKVGMNGGYDFNFQNFTVGPRLGLHYKRTDIEGYRERGKGALTVTGLELAYDRQHENSLTSVLGFHGSMAISTGFGVLVPQTTIEYIHEFLDDQRKIAFTLVNAPAAGKFRFQNDPPDRNYFNLGVGIVAVLPHGFSPFVNYRALVGYNDQSSHTVTAGLRIEF